VLGMFPEAQRIKCRIWRSDVWNAKSLEMALVDKAPEISRVTGAMSVSHMHSSLFLPGVRGFSGTSSHSLGSNVR
jgi:hypothetical protein